MDTLFVKRSLPFLQLFMKSWYTRNTSRNHSVDLAHKIYGDLAGNIPIIVLHGLLGSKKNWNSTSEKLQNAIDRTVIAVDARNHGESPRSPSHLYTEMAADVKQLIKKLLLKEAIILGHSMGGRTAMVLALTEPSVVSSLIVVDISPVSCPSVMNDFFPRLMDVMKSIKFDGVKDLPAARNLAKHKLLNCGIYMDHGTINFVLMNVVQSGNNYTWMVNVDVLKKYFTNIATFPLELSGKTYGGPTLFICGEESHFVPKKDADGIKAMFPLVEIVHVEDAGHNVHIDAPNIFVELVSSFVAKYST